MADPTVKVVVELDDSKARGQLKKFAAALARLRTVSGNATQGLESSAKGLFTALKALTNSTNQLVGATKKLGSESAKTGGSITRLAQASTNFLRTTLSSISGASQLSKQLTLQAQAAGLTAAQVQSVAQATGAFSSAEITAISRSAQLSSAIDVLNKELKEGKLNSTDYTNRLSKLAVKFRDVGTFTKNAKEEQKRLNDEQKQGRVITGGLIGSYVKLRIAMDAVRQAAQLVVRAFDFAEQGAQIQQTTVSFNNFADGIAGIPDLLEQLNEKAAGTVSEFALMTSTLTLTAGVAPDVARTLAEASPGLLEIARAAAILNPSLGDTQVLFDRLALGIKRSSSRILDDLGIIVKLGDANKAYAESIGSTVAELTAEERQIALLNETLRAGQNLINQAGDAAEDTIDPFLRLRVAFEEVKNEAQRLAADGMRPLLGSIEDLLKVAQRGIPIVFESGGIGTSQAEQLSDDTVAIAGTAEAVSVLTQAIDDLGQERNNLDIFQQVTGLTSPLQAPLSFLAVEKAVREFRQSVFDERDRLIADTLIQNKDFEDAQEALGLDITIAGADARVNAAGLAELSEEELRERLFTKVLNPQGELELIVDFGVVLQLQTIEADELSAEKAARRAEELGTAVFDKLRRVSTNLGELDPIEVLEVDPKATEELEKLAEASRDFAISSVESSAKLDDFGKLLFEAADELDLTEDEVLDLALSLGILDEETFQNAQSLIDFRNLLIRLGPALAGTAEEAAAAQVEIDEFLSNLPEEDIEIEVRTNFGFAEGLGQDFISEQVDLFTERAEKELELAELTAPTLVPSEVVIARLQARLDADLTDDVRKEIEERLSEDIPDAERITLEARLDADLSDDERRDTLLRIAEIRDGGDDFVTFIQGTRKEIQGLEEDIESLNDEIAQNFLRSIFEATVAQEGWTEKTLQFGISLGVIDPGIEDVIRGAIELGEEFDTLTGLLEDRGITAGSQAAAKAFAALDLGKTAEEALAVADAFVALQRGAKAAAVTAQGLKDQSLFEIEGVGEPAIEKAFVDDRPTLLNLALPEEFKDDVEEVGDVVEGLTTEDHIIDMKVNPEMFDELDAILNIMEQIQNGFPSRGGSGGGTGSDVFRQFGGPLAPGQVARVGEVREELIVPQVPVDVLSRVPAGFNSAVSSATPTGTAPTINNTSIDNSRSVENTNSTTNALSIQVPNPTEAIEVVRNIQGGAFIG